MPWHIEEQDGRFCVVKDSDGETEDCHDTRAQAEAHMRALYASENESPSGITFVNDQEVAASFRADIEKRIIQGLMIPWGKVARSGFAKWRFSPGSLKWSEIARVKLNLGHDRAHTVGVARRLQNGSTGLVGTFKVARGDDGDRALSLAEDGVLDGFSVEIDFEDGDGWRPDPSDESVRLVESGTLKGVALTGYPAFDDARVSEIAAEREKGRMMGEEINTTAPDPSEIFEESMRDLAAKVTESQERISSEFADKLAESVNAGFRTALEGMSDPQSGPSNVRAAKFEVMREEPTYRFDGTGSSLVRDAWTAVHERGTAAGDEASHRINRYRRQSEEVAVLAAHYGNTLKFAPQSTSTASQIIPPGYRPDLYVADVSKDRPLVNLASRGTIANATPFTVPVFTSATGVTADHVEGTNPSDGSVAFGTKTVTPQAVSGRLVLTREIVDSSNPAIDQIAMQAMRESYNRQTEAKVYTLLNGANGAGGTITTGFVPSGAQASTTAGGTDNQTLIKHIRDRLANYPFNRFASPTGAAMGAAATSRLATAVDTTQRPLLPSSGAVNPSGLGNAVSQGWTIDGLGFVPAWAMTGVGAGDSQIFILNRSDLWVWESSLLTFRFEEKQGPANIELNVFGYFGTHLLRPVGLSGIRIT